MNILILGGGGREHAFAWKIRQSPHCKQLYIAPGNAGTAQCGTNLPLSLTDFEAIAHSVAAHQIEMIVVGPEVPLVSGIFDYFAAHHPQVHVVGPSAQAAQLEGSKSLAKSFMQSLSIPTATHHVFDHASRHQAMEYLNHCQTPVVLKADGLAAGKGVVIAHSTQEARQALDEMMAGAFGEAGQTIVIEEFLTGIEFSVFLLTDGRHYKILPIAKDYKRIGEADTGLNTGGMGSVSPPPFVDDDLMEKVEQRIIRPTLQGLRERDWRYEGFLYLGLISVQGEPYVIEYNCRMGDPETQSVLMRLNSDLVEAMFLLGKPEFQHLQWYIDTRPAATVVAASGGYPKSYQKGKNIQGLDRNDTDEVMVFHAGTQSQGTEVVTTGGRVLAVTAKAESMQQALQKAYERLDTITFDGKYQRSDIGFDL